MFRITTFLVAAIAAGGVAAAEPQYLAQSTGGSNSLGVEIFGDANALYISQDFLGTGSANEIALSVEGDRNGGVTDWAFGGELASQLLPGTLMQSGSGNRMQVAVQGSDNSFAFAQVGTGNSLTASISGSYNQALVYQVGNANTVNFSQNGTGNTLLVSQRSW